MPRKHRYSSWHDRRPAKLNPQPVITIHCEGEKTEPFYFEALKREWGLHTLTIHRGRKRDGATRLLDAAIAELERSDSESGDEVWCVLDIESAEEAQVRKTAILQASNKGIHIAASNPCFEYWYLLHFEFTTRPFERPAQVSDCLKTHLPTYDKGSCPWDDLHPRICQAMGNALRAKQNGDQDAIWPNPSTQVHLLIQKLLAVHKGDDD